MSMLVAFFLVFSFLVVSLQAEVVAEQKVELVVEDNVPAKKNDDNQNGVASKEIGESKKTPKKVPTHKQKKAAPNVVNEVNSAQKDTNKESLEVKTTQKTSVSDDTQAKTINKIAIIIYTDEESIIITQHDLQCKSLDGRVRTPEEIIFERLAYWEAQHVFKMSSPEEAVDRHLASIREQHGVSDEEVKHLFKESGYTFEEGKEQLRISYTLQRLFQELITSRIIVTETEIKEYHEKHPIKEPASYRVQKGFIAHGKMSEKERAALIEDGEGQEDIEWSNPYWLNEDEIAEHKKFIMAMRPGEISKPDKCEGGFEVVKLIKRRKESVLSLEERYAEIANQLRLPKYEKMLAEYKEKLFKKYEIVRYT